MGASQAVPGLQNGLTDELGLPQQEERAVVSIICRTLSTTRKYGINALDALAQIHKGQTWLPAPADG